LSLIVQIQGEQPIFPGNACVHCLQPATQQIEIVQVKGDVVRKIQAPFCDECLALRRAKSPRQIQFERLALASNTVLALVAGAWTYTQVSDLGRRMWGLLLGILVALIVFGIMYLITQPWAAGFRSPETKAALQAIAIKDFNWDTTTLEFANKEYGERFAQVNRKE